MKASIIAILAGICTALVLVLGAASFYFWQSNQKLSAEVSALRAERAAFTSEMEKVDEISRHNACLNYLRQIDGATQQWALEKSKRNTDQATMNDIVDYLGTGRIPRCPAGGTYTVGYVGGKPHCSIETHTLDK